MSVEPEPTFGHLSAGRREVLLREAASVLAKSPLASMSQIAHALSLSRATLHRYVGRRENLIAILLAKADEVTLEAATRAELTGDDHHEALDRLIGELQACAPFIAMLYAIHVDVDRIPDSPAFDEADRQIMAFFERGQRAHHFAPHLTAAWLSEALYSLILAGEWSVQTGRCARHDLPSLVGGLFTHGAVVAKQPATK